MVSCSIQTGQQNDRSQQTITKNSSTNVYGKPLLVNSNKHCTRVLIIPDVAIPAVELAISREAGLINKHNMCGKGRISNTSLQKPLDKLNMRCRVAQP
jgi:hypothetical protein